jgi:hypothetical protein
LDDAIFVGAFPPAIEGSRQFAGSCGFLPLLVGVHPRPIALSSQTKAAWRTKMDKDGGLEHFLFSPLVGMMIQSDFHIFQGGGATTN